MHLRLSLANQGKRVVEGSDSAGTLFKLAQWKRYKMGDRKTLRCLNSVGLIAGAVATVLAVGAPANAESLRQALGAAYRYNPELDAARARLRGTDEEVARAVSGYRPIISASADFSRRYQKTEPSVDDGTSRTYPKTAGVSLTQNIFNGFQTLNAVRESEALVRATREDLRALENRVLLDAVTAYMNVIRDQAIVRLRENNVNVLARELKAVQDRFAVGEVTRTDLAQSRARRAFAVSTLDAARADLKSSRAVYERIIGHAPRSLKEPTPNAPGLPRNLRQALAAADQENPNNISALYAEKEARHTVDRIRGELLPQVTLNADYGRTWDSMEGLDSRGETASVTGRLAVPLYNGGETRARVRQAKHLHVASMQAIEQARSLTRSELTTSWSQLEAARARRASDQTQVEANRTALAGVREEERVGQRTLLDVLNAELELLNSEVQLVTTRRDLVVLAYSVVAGVGRLDALGTGVAEHVYDPEVNYRETRTEAFSTSITRGPGSPTVGDWSTDVQKGDEWSADVDTGDSWSADVSPSK